jgi:UDP-N-acetylmuramate: L-alanyl-gamma-D-glutamyl-meso-diaminopimelate ligase
VLSRGCWSELESFDVEDGWHARAIDEGAQHAFDVSFCAETFGRLRLPLTGRHNRSNALAAIAAARHAGVAPRTAIEALGRFGGVKRRLEVRGIAGGVTVYDDFAHHPTAIATTVAGLRRRVGSARILAVLEPRSNTMKLGTMSSRLPESLQAADLVFCYGASSGRNALGWQPAQALAPLGPRARSFGDLDALVVAVAAAARRGDHVLVMSNGGFGGVHEKLLSAFAGPAMRERVA